MTMRLMFMIGAMLGASAVYGNDMKDTARKETLARVVEALEQSRIARIEILHMPDELLTRSSVLPEMLDSGYFYKLEVKNVPAVKSSLLKALQKLNLSSSDTIPDLRWAIAFYDSENTRITTIYIDSRGRHGVIDGTNIKMNGSLYSWINDNWGRGFR